jgi:hypothetical protein
VNISAVHDGAGTQGAADWELLAPVEGPARLYRRELGIQFPVVKDGVRLRVVEVGTVAAGAFLPLDYDALHPPGAVPAATVTSAGSAIVLELPGPARILRISIRHGGRRTERLQVKANPTTGAAIAEGVEAGSLDRVLLPISRVNVELHRMDGPHPVADPTLTAPSGELLGAEFTDARFAIVATRDGEPTPIEAGDLEEVFVRSFPLGARVTVGPAPDRRPDAPIASPSMVFLAAGDFGGTTPAAAGSFDAGGALARALQIVLDDPDRRRNTALDEPPPPATIEVPLVFESGAPARVSLSAFSVEMLWVVSAFDGTAEGENQVLRFGGSDPGSQTLMIRVDAEATVTEASVRSSSSFRADRPPDDAGSDAPERAAERGLQVGGGQIAALRLDQTTAVSASGISLGLLPLDPDTDLMIEVRDDHAGSPSGRTLWIGSVLLGPPGTAAWYSAPLDVPVVLSSDPHWVVVAAKAGRAIWLAIPGEGVSMTGDAAGILFSPVAGASPLLRILTRGQDLSDDPPFAVSVGSTIVPRTLPTAEPSTPSLPPGDRYDLSAAVAAYVASHPSSSTIRVPLTFAALAPGNLTVYPPEVVYDLRG